jgi:hypothetical protein
LGIVMTIALDWDEWVAHRLVERLHYVGENRGVCEGVHIRCGFSPPASRTRVSPRPGPRRGSHR